jgi:FKBP-type peptidyl-prolyl cis-trans isomerase
VAARVFIARTILATMARLRLSILIVFGVAVLIGAACTGAGRESIPVPDDVAAPPPGSLKTVSGLSTKVLNAGTGTRHPRPTDRVTVHYTGWTTDGKMFDSSVANGTPATFSLAQVIPGWTEGLQLMVEGERRRFWIPESLAYKGQPGSPQGMLVFDVELIRID